MILYDYQITDSQMMTVTLLTFSAIVKSLDRSRN